MTGSRRTPVLAAGAVLAVVARPGLWPTAVRVTLGVLRPGWWHHWPPRPEVPDAYLEWRRTAMWGDDDSARLSASEAVAYLGWCRRMRLLG